MIHNDIQNQLQLLIKTSAPPLIEVAAHAVEAPQWTPGQQIPAHVLASLPNGRFQVRVGEQILDLNLPRNTQPGDQLELTYVTNTPRLTFALMRDVPGAVPGNGSAPVSLSEAAKLIGALQQSTNSANLPAAMLASGSSTAVPPPAVTMQPGYAAQTGGMIHSSVQHAAVPEAGSPVLASARILAATQPDIPRFAQALSTALSQSGLFYEAHQVQWLSGERNLASLRQEPQGKLAPLQLSSASMPAAGANPSVATPASMATLQPPNIPLEQGRTDMAVHPQTVTMVQQQLQALDTRQVIWQGQVWPGQQMQWEIEEEGGRQRGESDEQSTTWHTRLNLQLPTLGGVSARLAFVNGTVQLDIATDSAASAAMMRQQQTELAERFNIAGLQLQGVTIQHG